jgi:lipopolysaccharide transport protein LptA
MLKTDFYCLSVLFLLVSVPVKASPPGDGSHETISIFADEASEDILPEILHFKGHFIMQTHEWRLESGQATVYGNPDRPDKVHLEGSPARFLINRDIDEGQGTVEATAPEMEYQRSTSNLRLSGGAMLKLDDEVIQSMVIEYNIDTERYKAGGEDGVVIEVPPVD